MAKGFEHVIREGTPFVIVPEELFDQLVQDAEMLRDIKAYDVAKARIKTGKAEFFPAEVMSAFLFCQKHHP